MFSSDRDFKVGIASRDDYILNSATFNDFQNAKVLTSISWRHNHV